MNHPAARSIAGVLLALALLAACGDPDHDTPDHDTPDHTHRPDTVDSRPPGVPHTDTTTTTRPDPRTAADDAAGAFLSTYVDADGRVVRHGEAGDTVSEGQAYAMLLAAAVGDRDTFERVWGWTREHLRRADGLLAWHWRDGGIVDPQPAADADLDAAHALHLAAVRFEDPALAADATTLADAIHRHLTIQVDGGRLLVAGPWAVTPRRFNPSYLSPLAMSVLFRYGDDARWGEIAGVSRAVVDELTAQPPHLPPDWAELTASGPRAWGDPPVYGFDAVRTPWRFALDCEASGRALAARAWEFLESATEGGTIPPASVHGLDGAARRDDGHAAATVGAAAAAAASSDDEAATRLLDLAAHQDREQPSYYGAAMVALGRLGLETDLLGECA